MSYTAEQISALISQLPRNKFQKIDWRKDPKLVARITKALLLTKVATTQISKLSGVHNQILYAIMRGKTPDGSSIWKELCECLTKMKVIWRGKDSDKVKMVPVEEAESVSVQKIKASEETVDLPFTNSEDLVLTKIMKRVVRPKNKVSTTLNQFIDVDTKEVVVITTTRYKFGTISMTISE